MKIVIIAAFSLFTLVMVSIMSSPEGIVTLDGWRHGVAICGEAEKDFPLETQEGEYHMWAEDGILYTVNYGHMQDDEVEQLKFWAAHECAQFSK